MLGEKAYVNVISRKGRAMKEVLHHFLGNLVAAKSRFRQDVTCAGKVDTLSMESS